MLRRAFLVLFGMLEAGHIDTISNQITITEARISKICFLQHLMLVDGVQITVTRKGRDDIQ